MEIDENVKKCPHCRHEVDYLIEYENTSGWQRNTVDLNGERIDFEDSETTDCDHEHYECPHCRRHIVDLSDLIDIEMDLEREIKKKTEERKKKLKTEKTGWNIERITETKGEI